VRWKQFPGFSVPAIGQGTGGNDLCEEDHRVRLIQDGVDQGLTLIDTAEDYRRGESERVVGKAIRGRRDKVFLATKFNTHHHRYEDVIAALEGSLSRLGVDCVDLYQIHWPNPTVPIEETMAALEELQKSGKIRHIGVSNFSPAELIRAQESIRTRIVSNQVEYNFVDRGAESSLLPLAAEHSMMVIAYNPLLLSSGMAGILDSLARKYEKTRAQVILNWLAGHERVVCIPKTLNLEHMQENALATDFGLLPEDRELIHQAFQPTLFEVPVQQIRVSPSLHEPVYLTLHEALENRLQLEPSPLDLAENIRKGSLLKPVRLKRSGDMTGNYEYDLVQGRVRYWAWVIARQSEPIPAYLVEEKDLPQNPVA
jgi:diketogulonate reductase-like aldo/keto reductase